MVLFGRVGKDTDNEIGELAGPDTKMIDTTIISFREI